MEIKKYSPAVICSLIIALGVVIAAVIFSNGISNRPLYGNFSGSLTSYGGYSEPSELMSIYALQEYLGIYPDYQTIDKSMVESGEDVVSAPAEAEKENVYDTAQRQLIEKLSQDITGGKWPGFPYVMIEGTLYFNKTAVDNWFAEMGSQQWVIN